MTVHSTIKFDCPNPQSNCVDCPVHNCVEWTVKLCGMDSQHCVDCPFHTMWNRRSNGVERTVKWCGADSQMVWNGQSNGVDCPFHTMVWTVHSTPWCGLSIPHHGVELSVPHHGSDWSAPHHGVDWSVPHHVEWTVKWCGIHSQMVWNCPFHTI